jgi:hypothetical protein
MRLGDGASLNRSSALQLWAIGTIAPILTILWNIFERGLESDWFILWTAGQLALFGDITPARGTEFTYPPHALFFFTPFATIPYVASYIAWNALTAVFFLWAARSYLPRGFPHLLALLTPGALMCIHFGQTGLLMGGLWLLAFRGSWASVALLTFKPHLGILSALTLRSRAALLKTVALTLALMAASLILFGPTAWYDFLDHLLSHESQFATRVRWQFLGVSPALAYGIIGWLPFALAAGLMLMRNFNAFTAATAALLVSPYGFTYDMPLASLGIGLAIWAHWSKLGWGKRLGLMLGFLVPTLAGLGVWWIPPILLWTLWVQVNLDENEASAPGATRRDP